MTIRSPFPTPEEEPSWEKRREAMDEALDLVERELKRVQAEDAQQQLDIPDPEVEEYIVCPYSIPPQDPEVAEERCPEGAYLGQAFCGNCGHGVIVQVALGIAQPREFDLECPWCRCTGYLYKPANEYDFMKRLQDEGEL